MTCIILPGSVVCLTTPRRFTVLVRGKLDAWEVEVHPYLGPWFRRIRTGYETDNPPKQVWRAFEEMRRK